LYLHSTFGIYLDDNGPIGGNVIVIDHMFTAKAIEIAFTEWRMENRKGIR